MSKYMIIKGLNGKMVAMNELSPNNLINVEKLEELLKDSLLEDAKKAFLEIVEENQ